MKKRWVWGYAILGGAVAWMLHLLATYAIGEWACILDGSFFNFLGVSSAGWTLILVSTLCLAASVGSVIISSRLKKDPKPQIQYLGKFGVFSGLIFSLAILAQSVPVFTLSHGC